MIIHLAGVHFDGHRLHLVPMLGWILGDDILHAHSCCGGQFHHPILHALHSGNFLQSHLIDFDPGDSQEACYGW